MKRLLRAALAPAALAALAQWPAAAHAQELSLPGCSLLRSDHPLQSEALGPDRPGAVRWRASGNVYVECGRVQLFADEIEIETDRSVFHIRGHVQLEQPGLHLYAERAALDRETRLGSFFGVYGTAQTGQKKAESSLFGGLEPDIAFWADELAKTGPETFEFRGHGTVTSCVQATPRWSLSGTGGSFTHNRHVTFSNAVLAVKGVPVFYVPFIYYPINEESRSTGFLLPSFGTSTIGGFTFSSAFFWAIDRSQDLTLYHDFLRRSGHGLGAEYRFASAPGSYGDLRVYTLGERPDPAFGLVGRRSYTVRGQVNQALPQGLLLVGQATYFSSATTQQLYQQNVIDASQRTRSVTASITGGHRRYRYAANYSQNDLYTNLTTVERRGYAPRLTLSLAEAPIGRSRVYFGANGETAYLLSQDDLTAPGTDRSLWRFDARPTLRWPLSTLPYLSVTTTAAWQITEWLESRDPNTLEQRPTPITRNLLSLQASVLGPVFSRVWQPPRSRYADRVKHLIEPNVTVQWYSPFNRLNEVVPFDGVDRIVGGTTSWTYGVRNRLLVRPRSAQGQAPVREILAVEIGQSYYTNALAAAVDPQYAAATTSTSRFSPAQLTVSFRPVEALSGQFRTDIDPRFKVARSLGASAALTLPRVQWSAGWSKRQFIPGLPGYDNPAFADHFFNGSTSYKATGGRLGGTYSMNYDVRRGVLVQQRIVAFYNSQCCGVSVDYQTTDLSHLGLATLRANRHIGISLTLAGLGTFSNPLGSFGR